MRSTPMLSTEPVKHGQKTINRFIRALREACFSSPFVDRSSCRKGLLITDSPLYQVVRQKKPQIWCTVPLPMPIWCHSPILLQCTQQVAPSFPFCVPPDRGTSAALQEMGQNGPK